MIFSLNTLPRHPPSLQEACPASPLTTKRHSHICGRFARPTCNITIPTRTFLSAKKIPRAFGWFRLALYPVHGKLHGKFSATSLQHNAVRASVVPEALSFASPFTVPKLNLLGLGSSPRPSPRRPQPVVPAALVLEPAPEPFAELVLCSGWIRLRIRVP